MSGYIFSPEFHRNLWLQFSTARLIAAPALVALTAYTYSRMPGVDSYDLVQSCVWAFWLVAIVWGAHAASSALADEVRNNTWDFQRTSSISPALFVFGKLFGATSYIWYFAFLIWGLFSVCYFKTNTQSWGSVNNPVNPVPGYEGTSWLLPSYIYTTLGMFLSALFAQGLALGVGGSMIAGSRTRKGRKFFNESFPGFIIAFIAGTYFFFGYSFSTVDNGSGITPHDFLTGRPAQWHGMTFGQAGFALASLVFFLGWVYAGLWRFVRHAFSFSLLPVGWPLFVASIALYFSGFIDYSPETREAGRVGVWFGIAFLLTYTMMFAEASDTSVWRRMLIARARKDREAFLRVVPSWLTSLPIVIVPVLAYAVLVMQGGVKATILTAMIAALLFAARDALVLHLLAIRKPGDRFMVVLYYILVYLLLPALHANVKMGDIVDTAADMTTGKSDPVMLVAIYFPTGFDRWHMSLIPPLLEVLAVALYFIWYLEQKGKKAP